nr:MAG TPA: hypothetical protein [Bacteriophage sp.]
MFRFQPCIIYNFLSTFATTHLGIFHPSVLVIVVLGFSSNSMCIYYRDLHHDWTILRKFT